MSKVFVLDTQTRPLNPVHAGRARLLLTQGRAAVFRLTGSGVPVEVGTGGRTKFNRTQQALPKTHWLDAACVGASTPLLHVSRISPLLITARGHGNRQMCGTDCYGFPMRHRSRRKSYLGFRTGDVVRATVPSGKVVGSHTGCVTIRQRPSLRINGHDVHPRYCTHLHKGDGYAYARSYARLVGGRAIPHGPKGRCPLAFLCG